MGEILNKFKQNRFIRFVIRHKKLSITVVTLTALVIVILIPIVVSLGSYNGDFTYALNAYKDTTQPFLDTSYNAVFKAGTVTEEIDGVIATTSNSNYSTTYVVDVTEEGKYSLFIRNHLLGNGFKDS